MLPACWFKPLETNPRFKLKGQFVAIISRQVWESANFLDLVGAFANSLCDRFSCGWKDTSQPSRKGTSSSGVSMISLHFAGLPISFLFWKSKTRCSSADLIAYLCKGKNGFRQSDWATRSKGSTCQHPKDWSMEKERYRQSAAAPDISPGLMSHRHSWFDTKRRQARGSLFKERSLRRPNRCNSDYPMILPAGWGW